MITSLGAGYAIVTVPPVPDWNTSAGGGPISKSTQASVPAHAGNYVFRTPHNVVREAEAGANWPIDLPGTMMFLPDGKLAPALPYAYDQFSGPEVIVAQPMHRGVKPAFFTMLLGGAAGGALIEKHRIAGTIGGAVVGGVLGLIFG